MSRCPRCDGKIIREDDIVTRQPEHTCIACGWNDLRPVMSAEEAAKDAAHFGRRYRGSAS